MSSYYINTDLDIVSGEPIDKLMAELEETTDVLNYSKSENGKWYACLEASGSGELDVRVPEEDIVELLIALSSVRDESKEELSLVESIDFNVGWQSSLNRPEGSFNIHNRVLRQIADIGGSVTTTIYPSSENDDECPPGQ